MRIGEFDPETAWWNDRKETMRAWKVPIGDIRKRGFNLDFKNSNAPDETHEDPDVPAGPLRPGPVRCRGDSRAAPASPG
jgi:hypothetical protein